MMPSAASINSLKRNLCKSHSGATLMVGRRTLCRGVFRLGVS